MDNLPDVGRAELDAFCRRRKVRELAFFGSVLRDDFGPESDVDVLVSFEPGTRYGLFEMARMAAELERLLGRRVDLVTRSAVESSANYIRRRHVLKNLKTVYVA